MPTARSCRADYGLFIAFGGPVWFAMTTGCRVCEMTSFEWNRLGLTTRTAWLNDTTNGTPRGIPLNQGAVENLIEQVGKHDHYCFISGQPGKTQPAQQSNWQRPLLTLSLAQSRLMPYLARSQRLP